MNVVMSRVAHGLAEQYLHSYEDTKQWVDSWKDSWKTWFFRRVIYMLLGRWEKVVTSDDQYFE